VPLALEPGPPVEEPITVEGSAETIEFDAIKLEPEPQTAPEHSFGPRALAVRQPEGRPLPPAPPPVAPRLRAALARPATARGALLAGAGALLGAMLSRRRRW
jgi:hypothetical protein